MSVRFTDPRLEQALRAALVRPNGPLATDDLARLTELDARGAGIESLEGLQHCTGLVRLFLDDNAICDIGPLAGLANLAVLQLNRNRVADLGPLAGLAQLVIVGITGNPPADLTPLVGLDHLARFSMSLDGVCDVGPLVECQGLGRGDWIYFTGTPSAQQPLFEQVRAMRARGVTIYGVP